MPRTKPRHPAAAAPARRRGRAAAGTGSRLGPRFEGQLRSAQLHEHLLGLLRKMRAGEKLPSERAIARETGLSLLTVNKVLASLAALGLVERRLGAGTYVLEPQAARRAEADAGAGQRLRLLRFVVRDVGSVLEGRAQHYLGRFYQGVCEAARADGLEVLPTPHTLDSAGLELLPEDAFEQAGVEGLIFVECEAPDYRPLWKFLAAGRRVVGMDFAAPEQGLSSVMFDNVSGMKELVAHCVRHGHRRLCFSGPGYYAGQPLDERVAGFRQGVQEAGLDPAPGLLLLAEPAETRGRLAELLRRKPAERPTAFIGYSDHYLLQVLEAAREAGLQLPRDASMAGFGGGWRTESLLPPLDTLLFDEVEMGRSAYRLLQRGAKGVVKREPGRLELNGSVVAAPA